MTAIEVVSDEGLPVKLPSGATFKVQTTDEVNYLTERVTRYLEDNHFVNVSDFQDIDRMLQMELLIHRWGQWLAQGHDYFGDAVDEAPLRRTYNDWSGELRQLKKMLGIDKQTRDKEKGSDSWPVYLANLLARAKEFGVMREEQLANALELTNQLIALIQLHDNCDEIERAELHVTMDDVIEWVRTVFIPEFGEVDAYFREHSQRFWIGEM